MLVASMDSAHINDIGPTDTVSDVELVIGSSTHECDATTINMDIRPDKQAEEIVSSSIEPEIAPELMPAESYQVDSDGYDSGSDPESLDEDEYEALVAEADTGFSEDEVEALAANLKERGLINFLREYLSPRPDGSIQSLRKLLLGFGIVPPGNLRDRITPNVALLPFTKVALSRILRRREKLSSVNSVDDAVALLAGAKHIIVLSGAGISTSCGIPDFRSATGLYAQLQAEGKYDLDDPQQMFDISYFREHPEVFYSFAKQIYPSNFTPSPCHRWIKLLEDRGVLLRNYTQNIDTLESLAGVTKVLQCHGSFSTASCLRCKTRVPGSAIEPHIMSQRIPYCVSCRNQRDVELAEKKAFKASRKNSKGKGKAKSMAWDVESESDDDDEDEWGHGEPGIIKPDITFFGQALDSEFDECLFRDREEVDLLVIMGTSLKVAPVAEVLSHIPHSVPQIFINLTPVTHVQPDICLIGDGDTIVTYLSHCLGWSIPPIPTRPADAMSPPAPSDSVPAVAIPPEEVVWLSGLDDFSHIHVLSSKTEQLARQLDGERGATFVDGTRTDKDMSHSPLSPVSPVLGRPSKRSRVAGSMDEEGLETEEREGDKVEDEG